MYSGRREKKRNKHKRWVIGRERRKREKKKYKTEKERAHRVRKAVSAKKGCFSAYQARNGSDSLSCRAKMPQTKLEIARVSYRDFHTIKHVTFGMPVEEAGIPLTLACLGASLKGKFPLAESELGTVG